jgi:excinuclease UvrABC helicase subunit UvrB
LDSNYPYAELKENVSKYVTENNVHYFSFYDIFAPYKPIDLWISKENSHWNDKATTIASDALSKYLINNDIVVRK